MDVCTINHPAFDFPSYRIFRWVRGDVIASTHLQDHEDGVPRPPEKGYLDDVAKLSHHFDEVLSDFVIVADHTDPSGLLAILDLRHDSPALVCVAGTVVNANRHRLLGVECVLE